MAFDYRSANERQIIDLAGELPGLILGQIPGARFKATEGRRGKGEVGLAIEAFFGIPPNQVSEADFIGAGIELKAVPLVRGLTSLRVKERTVISMIDYFHLAQETWATASVRRKLKILFVFVEHLYDAPKSQFPITHVTLWKASGPIDDQIRIDWERVQAKVLAGRAHELSESDGRILGPCTKGADSSHAKRQPFSDLPAKSRAFALKPAFTLTLFRETLGPRVDDERLAEIASLTELRRRFERFVDQSVDQVAMILGREMSKSKSYAANVVRAAVFDSSPTPRKELAAVTTIKTSRFGPKRMPYEALSFPAFRHIELVDEDWEDSALLAQVEQMLIVPVFGATRQTPQGDCVVGRPIFWRPTAEQLTTIEREWTMFRDLIAAGHSDDLPPAGQTSAIHVRPHGRDASDRDPTPGGGTQTRKSFWLNRRFVQEILTDPDAR